MARDVDAHYVPRCLSPEGCPIEDVAADPVINEKIEAFLMAKSLYRLTEDPKTQQKTFEDLDLYNDPNLHAQLEVIYSQWISMKSQSKK